MKRTKNLGLKLISLLFAVILAYFVNSEGNTSVVGFVVPVEFQNVPADKVLLRPSHRQVEVTIKGPSFVISKVAAEPRVIKVRLPAGVGNAFSAPLNRGDLGFPPAVQVVGLVPSEIEIMLDDLVTRNVPVVVPRIGSVKENFAIGEIEVVPNEVSVSGPRSEVGDISSVETYPIDLRGVTTSVRRELKIRVPGSLSTVSAPAVNVLVDIRPVEGERRLPKLALEVRSIVAGSFSISPLVASITIAGAKQSLSALKGTEIIPYVRISDEQVGAGKAPVAVDLPAGIRLVSVEPPEVKVIIPGKRK